MEGIFTIEPQNPSFSVTVLNQNVSVINMIKQVINNSKHFTNIGIDSERGDNWPFAV